MSLYIKKNFKYGGKNIILETGKIAKNTNGSVVINIDNTVVLCTVVVNKNIKNQDSLPLSVYYQEKTYAAGKIPGGFLKREGRPTDKEILTSRLIDRPIRPNINKFYKNEVQIICTVISAENNPDIAAMIGTYAAIGISDIPLIDTMGVARVGFNKEIGYWLNITNEINSELDIVIAGTKNSVLMVEAEAKEKTEAIILGAICYAHREMQVVINNINEFVEDYKNNKTNYKYNKKKVNISLQDKLFYEFNYSIIDTFYIIDKIKRKEALNIIINQVIEKFINNYFKYDYINEIFKVIIKKIFINKMFETKKRIDGRKLKTIRSLSIDLGILPSAHGSALFSRGDTQAIVAITLGSLRDAQLIEGLEEERYEKLMFHYNFPHYSVGEIGFLGIPKRREIGHGNLAKRAIIGVLSKEDFPYSIRIVSEITESNGSSSMASVCGASLALMDAGVPLSSTVAGVAMGLITKKENFLIITDIVGDEDKFGDMDLKVAGTKTGITSLQMDIKKQQGKCINNEILQLKLTLNQAVEAIKKIINKMNLVISKSRKKISKKAPSTVMLKIETEKISDVIGKGGKTIKEICDITNSTIDIQDDGKIHIYANNKINSQKAIEAINMITEEAKINKIYRGKVIRIMDFGAFVNLMPGTDGLVHISQIISGHVKNIRDFLNEGDIVTVKVIEKDNKGKIKLSIKEIDPMEKAEFEAKFK